MKLLTVLSIVILGASSCLAHDTWIQVDSPVVRPGDVAFVHLMLGNHGNEHRDFKLAGKISPEGWTLSVIGPSQTPNDLKPLLVDVGFGPKEGFWSGRYTANEPGLHVVSHTLDKLHGTTRAIKSGKSYLLVSSSLDRLVDNQHDFTKPLGHKLELVPLVDPIKSVRPGEAIRVRLLYEGKPLPDARVTFIPRGQALKKEFDADFERKTDMNGEASFTPREGNWLLVVVHHAVPEQKGEGYDKTHYTATLTIQVPQIRRATSTQAQVLTPVR